MALGVCVLASLGSVAAMRDGRGVASGVLHTLAAGTCQSGKHCELFEVIGEAGADADVVLAVAVGVGDASVDVVGLDEVEAEAVVEAGGDASAGGEAEGVAIDDEEEVDVFLGAAEEDLSVRDEAAGSAAGVAGAEEVVDDGYILVGIVDVIGVGHGDIGDDGEGAAKVEGGGEASAVEREAAALAWGRVGMEVVEVGAEFDAGEVAVLDEERLRAKEHGECKEEQEQRGFTDEDQAFSFVADGACGFGTASYLGYFLPSSFLLNYEGYVGGVLDCAFSGGDLQVIGGWGEGEVSACAAGDGGEGKE